MSTLSAPEEPLADRWDIRDAKAHGIIVNRINNRLALQFASKPTAKELFDAIVKEHENTNIGVSTFYTFVDMMNLHWDGTSSVSEHISSLSAANAKLVAMKKGFDDKFLAFLLLHSLPEATAWDNFKSSILGALPDGSVLSFTAVANHLTAEALRLAGTTTSTTAKSALKLSKQKKKGDMWCTFHKVSSHSSEDCYTLKCRQESKGKPEKSKGSAAKKKKSKKREKAH
jgi:hypothetical protein